MHWHNQMQRLTKEFFDDHNFRMYDGIKDQTQIYLALLHHCHHSIGRMHKYSMMNMRIVLLKGSQNRRQKNCSQRTITANEDGATLSLLKTQHCLLPLLQKIQSIACIRGKFLACWSQDHPLFHAFKESHAQFCFQSRYLTAESRLCNQAQLGSFAKVLRLSSRKKIGQLTKLHYCPLKS